MKACRNKRVQQCVTQHLFVLSNLVIDLEEMNKQIVNKFKTYEQSNAIFKLNEKKVKDQFD